MKITFPHKYIKLWLITVSFLICLGIVVYWSQSVTVADTCARMLNLATDDPKIGYIKGWVYLKIDNPNFLELAGWDGEIELMHYPELYDEIDIDWDFLGINSDLAFIRFNRAYADRTDLKDKRSIKSFTIGEGRDSIFIKLKNSNGLGMEWPEENIKKMVQVKSDVFIYCD